MVCEIRPGDACQKRGGPYQQRDGVSHGARGFLQLLEQLGRHVLLVADGPFRVARGGGAGLLVEVPHDEGPELGAGRLLLGGGWC